MSGGLPFGQRNAFPSRYDSALGQTSGGREMFHIVITLETTHKHLGTGSVLQFELASTTSGMCIPIFN